MFFEKGLNVLQLESSLVQQLFDGSVSTLVFPRMPWKDVVTMAADVARDGFNVTHDLGESTITGKSHGGAVVPPLTCCYCPAADALAKVNSTKVSPLFRDLFLPGGQAPLPGLLSRRLDLAAILDTVAHQGASIFYAGNLTQEMAAAVRKQQPPTASQYTVAQVTVSMVLILLS